jgi:hypothetical protein
VLGSAARPLSRRRRGLLVRIVSLGVVFLLLAGCLQSGTDDDGPPADDGVPTGTHVMQFREPLDLGTHRSRSGVGAFGTSCMDSVADGDCGLGEPVMEVDGNGAIYVSGSCCITVAPPVYVSRDGGATFADLPTPAGVRESLGIEGDFAVDDVGRVYFSDIEFAASFQMTVWDTTGAFLRHTKWPAPPLVDRDWVRAEGDGIVYYAYNTGTATNLYKSTDAAMTFTPSALYQAPFGLGNMLLGPQPGNVWILGGGRDGHTLAEVSTDGGTTWTEEETTIPSGGNFPVAAFDEAGRLYGTGTNDDTVTVSVRGADGQWAPAMNVSGPGHHRMPWIAAGASGAAVVVWYGTDSIDIDPDTEWFLRVALTLDAGKTWETVLPDPIPVIDNGDLGRQLLDFFQVEVGPDGAIHVAYSSLPESEGGPEEHLRYVRTEPIPQLAPTVYVNGP